jgi:hypothetical protein
MTVKFRHQTQYGAVCLLTTSGDNATIWTGYANSNPDDYRPAESAACGLTPVQAKRLAAALSEWADHQQQLLNRKAQRRRDREGAATKS